MLSALKAEAAGNLNLRFSSVGVSLCPGSFEHPAVSFGGRCPLFQHLPLSLFPRDCLKLNWEAHFFFFFQKPLSASSLSQSRLSLDRHSTLKEAERKKADFQKKLLLQSNASVEKVGHVQAAAGL